jgi:hypothetical protein
VDGEHSAQEVWLVTPLVSHDIGLQADVGDHVHHVKHGHDHAGDAVDVRREQPRQAHRADDPEQIGEDGAQCERRASGQTQQGGSAVFDHSTHQTGFRGVCGRKIELSDGETLDLQIVGLITAGAAF